MESPSFWKTGAELVDGDDDARSDKDSRNLVSNTFRFAMRNTKDPQLDEILFRIIRNWPLAFERHVLIGSSVVINVMAGISSFYVHSLIRREFFVNEIAKVRSTVSSYLMPTALSTVLFYLVVWKPMAHRIFRGEADKPVCPLCFEMRQILVSLSTGLMIPLFAAPLHSSYVVLGSQAYDIPPIRQFGRWCRFFGSRMAPVTAKLPYLVIGHALLSTATVYLQLKYLNGMAAALDVDPEIFHHLQSVPPEAGFNPIARIRAWFGHAFGIAVSTHCLL
ncbi:hypothetical protein M514_03915 [Trichuris suis]|uniref:Uncharacterized protein n=1 Tax=Trichuris suis TaxID=68888 RepID=A0A085N8Y5_9BILA|nr:hypothetical protein M513_03915 [Trichuris suis]KFD65931.1 hypothetical protein M514_03915 [Trichuris suis]KHJ45167.1 hypothetical protein D918_04471 [Trichuris suis]